MAEVLTSVLRPVARVWLRRLQDDLSVLPVPTSAARQHVPGPDADRVLVFGNGPSSGFGVRTQDLGLPGQLARAVAAATGRGAEVDLGRGRGMRIESGPSRLEPLRLQRYDAVVLTLGATDAGALLPASRWEDGLRELIRAVRDRASAGAPIVVVGIRPMVRTARREGAFGRIVDRHAARLDLVGARVAAAEPQARFVRIDEALHAAGAPYCFTPDSYRVAAGAVTRALVPLLDARHVDGDWAATRGPRDDEDTEARRQQAVDDLGVATRPATSRLERLVQSASDQFGTSGAAVTILDGGRQLHKASVGLPVGEMRRELTICDRTIRRDGALVVEDATSDPATAGADMRTASGRVRFYAGYPIESPDGYRLGALCVFDPEPRDSTLVDEEQLRELAMLVQNELWDEAGWTPSI